MATDYFIFALKYVLETGGLTQTQLAARIGVRQQAISAMKRRGGGLERNRRRIAEVYGYGYDDFLRLGREVEKAGGRMAFMEARQAGKPAPAAPAPPVPKGLRAGESGKVHDLENAELIRETQRKLLDIERMDPAHFRLVCKMVDLEFDKACFNRRAAKGGARDGRGRSKSLKKLSA